jgi:hypothetical protein
MRLWILDRVARALGLLVHVNGLPYGATVAEPLAIGARLASGLSMPS